MTQNLCTAPKQGHSSSLARKDCPKCGDLKQVTTKPELSKTGFVATKDETWIKELSSNLKGAYIYGVRKKDGSIDKVIIHDDMVYGPHGYSNSRKQFLKDTGDSFANKTPLKEYIPACRNLVDGRKV